MRSRCRPGPAMTPDGAGQRTDATSPLARRQLLVAGGRAAHVGALRRRRRPRGARRTRRARPRRHALLLLLAGLRPRARAARRGRRRAVRRLPRRPRRGRDAARSRRSSSATCPARTGIRPWRSGRDLYRDVWLVSQQAWFAAEIARRFGDHPAVCGWLVSNEMPLYGGPGHRRRDHRLGADRRPGGPVGRRAPADLARRRRLGHRGDGRGQRLLAPRARAARRLRRPALVPDAGRRAAPAALPRLRVRARRRVRQARSSSRSSASRPTSPRTRTPPRTTARCCTRRCSPARAAGSPGTTPTRRPPRRGPYRHHVFELHFGLTDCDGQAEGAARARCASSPSLVRELAADGWEPRAAGGGARRARALRARAALHRRRPTARTSATTCSRRTSPRARPTCRSGSSASVTGSRPTRSCSSHPCAKLLTGPGLDRLREPRARRRDPLPLVLRRQHDEPARAVALVARPSSSASSTGSATGSSTRSRTTRSCSSWSRTSASSRRARASPSRVAGEPSARAHLPVEPVGAEIVAIDSYGRPALLRHRVGAGQAVLCTYPLEHMAARTPWANPENTWRIYSALATLAGVERRVRVDDPRVLAGASARRHARRALLRQLLPVGRLARAGRRTAPATGRHGRSSSTPRARRRSALAQPAADGDRRHGRSVALAASALTKGGMPTST